MAIQTLIMVDIVGTKSAFDLAADTLTALRCAEVTSVQHLEYAFIMEAWVPRPWFEELRMILDEVSGGRVTAVWDKETRPAAAPVLLRNPRLVRPFEYLVELFSLPGRRGYDPTLLTFLALPLFFGFMIGDIGYGAAFLLMGLLLRRWVETPLGELASTFLMVGGTWSIVFGGVLFGELFSFELTAGPFRYHPLSRLRDFPALLWGSVFIGLAHLNLGLAIGFWYERRRAGLRLAVLRRISYVVLQAGLVLLAINLLGLLAAPLWIPGLAATAFAIALVSLGGGTTAVLEVPSFISNVLSYLRLGVLGLAKAIFGVGINEAALQAAAHGPAGWAAGAVVFSVGHAFVMGLALLTVSIQALRLMYVEFYTKVYRPEELGKFRPFRPTLRVPGRAG